jgi:hypothetical protein
LNENQICITKPSAQAKQMNVHLLLLIQLWPTVCNFNVTVISLFSILPKAVTGTSSSSSINNFESYKFILKIYSFIQKIYNFEEIHIF